MSVFCYFFLEFFNFLVWVPFFSVFCYFFLEFFNFLVWVFFSKTLFFLIKLITLNIVFINLEKRDQFQKIKKFKEHKLFHKKMDIEVVFTLYMVYILFRVHIPYIYTTYRVSFRFAACILECVTAFYTCNLSYFLLVGSVQ